MDQPPTETAVRTIQEAGVFVIPTLVTMGSMAGVLTGGLTPCAVPSTPTSAASVPATMVRQELALLVDCGLTAAEALTAATASAAAAFRLPDRGRVAPGRQADLLMVDGDPTLDITDSLSIRAVWRRGERLRRVLPAIVLGTQSLVE